MRIIAHLDMDAFFASVEEATNARLKGKPIVVGADPAGRGVVSTANYAARAYGIHSALPISRAWKLSEDARKAGKPPVVFVTPNFRKYEPISERIMGIIGEYAKIVEPVSIDEAYFDLSSAKTYKKAEAICGEIKAKIKAHEKLTSTVGLGPNKLIAKIASDMHKPDGLTVVVEKDAEKFIESMPIRAIPGVGPKTEQLLGRHGVVRVRDVKRFTREELIAFLGKHGGELYDLVRAHDARELVTDREIKSIGEEETFDEDTTDSAFITERLRLLVKGVMRRFIKDGFKSFKTVVIRVRFHDFETLTRSKTLKTAQSSSEALYFEALALLMPFFDKRENPKKKAFRLIGVRIEKLESPL